MSADAIVAAARTLPSVRPNAVAIGPDGSLFVITYNPAARFEFEPTTGALTTVGTNLNVNAYDLEIRPDGRSLLYANHQNRTVLRLEPATPSLPTLVDTVNAAGFPSHGVSGMHVNPPRECVPRTSANGPDTRLHRSQLELHGDRPSGAQRFAVDPTGGPGRLSRDPTRSVPNARLYEDEGAMVDGITPPCTYPEVHWNDIVLNGDAGLTRTPNAESSESSPPGRARPRWGRLPLYVRVSMFHVPKLPRLADDPQREAPDAGFIDILQRGAA